jgi:hypothetical protein
VKGVTVRHTVRITIESWKTTVHGFTEDQGRIWPSWQQAVRSADWDGYAEFDADEKSPDPAVVPPVSGFLFTFVLFDPPLLLN